MILLLNPRLLAGPRLFFGCLRHEATVSRSMSAINLETLADLDETILKEVVREAERRIDAQLATANAADQRASGWVALLVTVASAVIGGSAALITSGKHYVLAIIGVLVAGGFARAILLAIDVLRPKEWHFPGNLPENWIPEQWQCFVSGAHCDLKQAMLEQCATLNEQIKSNAIDATKGGREVARSMDWALVCVGLGAVAVGIIALVAACGVTVP